MKLKLLALAATRFLLTLFCAQATSLLHAGELTLSLSPAKLSVKRGEAPKVEAAITNGTSAAVTLVLPGDGSEVGWRTPVIGWSILPVTSQKPHPQAPQPDGQPRCGNINPLTRTDVFTLQPGESKTLTGWLYAPTDLSPGRCRAAFYYANEPERKLRGVVLGKNEEGVERLIAGSTPCKLLSNEVVITITE